MTLLLWIGLLVCLLQPWEFGLSDYKVRDGMTVPMSGTAAGVLPEVRR